MIQYLKNLFSSDVGVLQREIRQLRNENRALKGKLAYARRQSDPVFSIHNRHIASLQAKLDEHRKSYAGLQQLLAEVAAERDALRSAKIYQKLSNPEKDTK